MKDFRLYDISDFVIDEDFIRWVYEQREEDNLFWNNWLQQHPDKHLVVATARRIVESIQFPQSNINEAQVEQEVSRLMNTISSQQMQGEPQRAKVVRFKWWYAAAVLLLCVTGTWYFFIRPVFLPVPLRLSFFNMARFRRWCSGKLISPRRSPSGSLPTGHW